MEIVQKTKRNSDDNWFRFGVGRARPQLDLCMWLKWTLNDKKRLVASKFLEVILMWLKFGPPIKILSHVECSDISRIMEALFGFVSGCRPLPENTLNSQNSRWFSTSVYDLWRNQHSPNRKQWYHFFYLPGQEKDEGKDDSNCPPEYCKPRVPYEILFAIGGWSARSATNLMETYDVRTKRWFIARPNDYMPRAYHGVVAMGKLIYIVGGFDGMRCLNSVRCYNPETSVWSERGCMHEPRCYVSTAGLDNYIYAMGGFDGAERTNSVECYNPSNNQWTMLSPMNRKRSDASAATLDGKLYIAGGFDGEEILISAEVYSPCNDTWSYIRNMTNPRSGVSLQRYKGYLYVLGGWDGINRLTTGEKYNPTTNEWEEIARMLTPRSNFATAIVENDLYVLGGYNGTTTTPLVERYNETTGEWVSVPPMNTKRSALGACVLKDLNNAINYSFYGNLQQFRDSSLENDSFNTGWS